MSEMSDQSIKFIYQLCNGFPVCFNGPYSSLNYGIVLYPSPETCMYAVHYA